MAFTCRARAALPRCAAAASPAVSARPLLRRRLADAAGSGESGGEYSRSEAAMQDLYMRALEPKPVPLPPRAPEEVARGRVLYSTYVKLLWKRHTVQARDLNRKLRLKWAAIAALPTPELRREALVIDPRIPLRLRVATITPPLQGFHGGHAAATAVAADAAATGGGAGARSAADPADGGDGGAAAGTAAGGPGASLLSTLAARRKLSGGGGPSLLATMRAAGAGGGAAGAGGRPPPSSSSGGGGGVPPRGAGGVPSSR